MSCLSAGPNRRIKSLTDHPRHAIVRMTESKMFCSYFARLFLNVTSDDLVIGNLLCHTEGEFF